MRDKAKENEQLAIRLQSQIVLRIESTPITNKGLDSRSTLTTGACVALTIGEVRWHQGQVRRPLSDVPDDVQGSLGAPWAICSRSRIKIPHTRSVASARAVFLVEFFARLVVVVPPALTSGSRRPCQSAPRQPADHWPRSSWSAR